MRMIVFGSGASRKVPDGFEHKRALEQLEDHLRRWAPMAQESEVTIAMEPLRTFESNIINLVSEGAELVRRVNHPNVRLVADTFHMGCEGEGAEAIVDAGDLIVDVHCAEVEGRRAPGTIGEDLEPYFRALKDIGYQGGISIESDWKDQAGELPGAVAYLAEQYRTA